MADDVEMKPDVCVMTPPPSDSGSSSPPQSSPFCLDSEPGSPLLEHEQVHSYIPALVPISLFLYYDNINAVDNNASTFTHFA